MFALILRCFVFAVVVSFSHARAASPEASRLVEQSIAARDRGSTIRLLESAIATEHSATSPDRWFLFVQKAWLGRLIALEDAHGVRPSIAEKRKAIEVLEGALPLARDAARDLVQARKTSVVLGPSADLTEWEILKLLAKLYRGLDEDLGQDFSNKQDD